MNRVTELFLNYVKIDTQSDDYATESPSTPGQHNLAKLLAGELEKMGASDVTYDREHCYVYGKIPATDGGKCQKTLGLIAHMDTAPDASGKDVKPRIISDYDGGDILLNEEKGIVLETKTYPEIRQYIGKTLIVTDGTTLLGADDKAGVAEIMAAAEYLLAHPEIPHGPVSLAFTPDEEVGRGTAFFNKELFGADYAYTVDGGAIGELEFETFNAASAIITVHGISVHTGSAKNIMKNAAKIAAEFDSLLPAEQRPEYTEGREGFFHLDSISGSVELAKLEYLIRDHDRQLFEKRKEIVKKAAEALNLKYGEGTLELVIEDSYYNMREKIEPDYMFLVEKAKECMKQQGIEPLISPVRGGTDGARLSFEGIPTPNIFTGGHNYHGRFEYCCAESMEEAVKLIVSLVQSLANC
ncbi:MAG: peptidase T [Lachnospiraceae bacterium]|nr:peptidase T [Lachnospiraceae bacterium]